MRHLVFISMTLACLAGHASATVHYTYAANNPSSPTKRETASACASSTNEYTTYLGDVRIARIVAVGQEVIAAGSSGPNPFLARVDRSGCVLWTVTVEAQSAFITAARITPAGHIVVAGIANRSPLPLRNALRSEPDASFVARISADGSQLLSSSYLPGWVWDMAVDAASNIYLTGQATGSWSFPNELGVSPPLRDGPTAIYGAYFLKLNPTADRALASGYLAGGAKICAGGSSCLLSARGAAGTAIAGDPSGNIYMAGNTNAVDLPTTGGSYRRAGADAFVAKISPTGRELLYSTYLVERNDDAALYGSTTSVNGIAVDASGSAIVVGGTRDPRLPTRADAVQPKYSGPEWTGLTLSNAKPDAFIAKLNPSGSAITWATYYGRAGSSESFDSVTIAATGDLLLSGEGAIVQISGDGKRLLYAGEFAIGWGRVTELGSDGLVYASGSSGLVSAFRPGAKLSARILGLTNAASQQITGEIAPGEIVSLYGPGIGPAQEATFTLDTNGRIATSLAGIQVMFNDRPAPLLYVSPSQINAIVPVGLEPGSVATVRSTVAGNAPAFNASVQASSPGVFAILNQNGTINSPNSPAQVGSIVTVWMTGVGADAVAGDGVIATTPFDTKCCEVRNAYTGDPVEVLYAGHAPGNTAALTQLNIRVASAGGLQILTSGGKSVDVTVFNRP